MKNVFLTVFFSLERIGPQRCLEGAGRTYYYDRYAHRAAMVYIRRCQSSTWTSTATTAIHARITQKEVRRSIKKR